MRFRAGVVFIIGVFVGMTFVTPGGAHVNDRVGHVWQHLKQRTDNRFVNERDVMWVYVDSDGSIKRQSGGITVSNTGTGAYAIFFPRSVASYGLQATMSSIEGEIATVNCDHPPTGVSCTSSPRPSVVVLTELNGSAANAAFTITALR